MVRFKANMTISTVKKIYKMRRQNSMKEGQMHKVLVNGIPWLYGSKMTTCLLSTIGDWDFNIFTLDKLTNGRPLFHVCLHLFQEYNLIDIFQLDIVKLMRCFMLIEEGYHGNNPYHNVVHAADVTQAMHCYLSENQVAQTLNPLEIMVAILSSATHDLDHPGVNQAFLVATSNHLAALYNNSSVLENHHWRSAIAIFRECGVFDHLDQAIWNTIEWQLKSLILATDITRQQEFINQLKKYNESGCGDRKDEGKRHFMLQMALKCADISNPCRTWELSRRWSELVCDEFFHQGDTERKLQIPVTPLCDRYKTTVSKIQSGFMQFVVNPLFQEWKKFIPSVLSDKMVANITSNKLTWDSIIVEADKVAVAEKQKEEKVAQQKMQESVRRILDDSDLSEEEENRPPIVESVQIHPLPRDLIMNSRTFIEDTTIPTHCQQRRHSMPPPKLSKDLGTLLQQHRDSFPRVTSAIKRRHSLPTKAPLLNGTSIDKLTDKLSQVAEAGSQPGSTSTLSSTIENLMASGVSPKLSQGDLEGMLYAKLTHRRKSEPLHFLRRRGSDTDYLLAQLQKSSKLGRPAWKENVGLNDIEQAAVIRNLFNRRGSNGSMRTHSSSLNTFGRQVLRPLTGNSRVSPIGKQFGSSNEGFLLEEGVSTMSPLKGASHPGYDRPRSLSLDAKLADVNQHLLLRLHEHILGEGESGNDFSLTHRDIEEDTEHSTISSTALYEEDLTSITMPLLSDTSSTAMSVLEPSD